MGLEAQMANRAAPPQSPKELLAHRTLAKPSPGQFETLDCQKELALDCPPPFLLNMSLPLPHPQEELSYAEKTVSRRGWNDHQAAQGHRAQAGGVGREQGVMGVDCGG